MPSPTYIQIATTTVGAGGATDITFSNIPATYTDLLIKASLRDDVTSTGTYNNTTISFNGSTANATYGELYGTGSAAGSGTTTNAKFNYVNTATATTSTFSNGELYIPNYTGANNKSSLTEMVPETNAAATGMVMGANLWSQTAAITSIGINPTVDAKFVQYSTVTLYGIKNS